MPRPLSREERLWREAERAHKLMSEKYVTLREHVVELLGCANCGAKAGHGCNHDHGCIDSDRSVS